MAIDANALRQRGQKMLQNFSPIQLGVLGLLGVITIVGAMAFLRWASTPDYTVLFSGMDPKDAASAVDQLESEGVPYKLADGGGTIMVPRSNVHDARLKLSSAGLPAGGVVGYEILDKQGLTTSEFRQRVDYQRAVEGELTRTLMAMDGVRAASVHLAIPEDQVFTDEDQPTRASVLLDTGSPIGDEAVQSVVHLVASSVPGLTPDNVTIADTTGRVLSSSAVADGAATNRQIRLQKEYEQQLSTDASSMLAQVFGPGHAVVRVSAQMNFDEREVEQETFEPVDGAVLREDTSQETFTGSGAPPGGALDTDPALEVETDQTEYQRQDESREMGVNRTVERSRVAPGTVERLSVAVVLDGGAEPVPDAEKVQNIVAAALGLDTERGDNIAVDTVEFDNSLAEAAKEAESAAASQQSMDDMLGYARTGVGALLLVLVLVFLIRGMKKTTAESIALPDEGPGSLAAAIAAAQGDHAHALAGMPAAALTGAAAALGTGNGGAAVPMASSSGDTQVLELIDQQPDEVAVLLRSWLADRRS